MHQIHSIVTDSEERKREMGFRKYKFICKFFKVKILKQK